MQKGMCQLFRCDADDLFERNHILIEDFSGILRFRKNKCLEKGL